MDVSLTFMQNFRKWEKSVNWGWMYLIAVRIFCINHFADRGEVRHMRCSLTGFDCIMSCGKQTFNNLKPHSHTSRVVLQHWIIVPKIIENLFLCLHMTEIPGSNVVHKNILNVTNSLVVRTHRLTTCTAGADRVCRIDTSVYTFQQHVTLQCLHSKFMMIQNRSILGPVWRVWMHQFCELDPPASQIGHKQNHPQYKTHI